MLGTILIIIGCLALVYFGYEIFFLLYTSFYMLTLLKNKRIRWPGPKLDITAKLEQKRSPFPMFSTFLFLVGVFFLNMILILLLIIFIFPHISDPGANRMILWMAVFAASILVGLLLIKPAYGRRRAFQLWDVARIHEQMEEMDRRRSWEEQ